MKQEDLKPLANVYCRAYAEMNVGEGWDRKSAHRLIAYWFNRQPDLSFTAEYERKIAGAFLAGIKPWWDGNHLVDGEIFVDPAFQGRGIGRELSRRMYQAALNKYDAKYFDAITFKTREFPLKWYKSLGFKEIENWTIISGDIKKALGILNRPKNSL